VDDALESVSKTVESVVDEVKGIFRKD